MPCSKLLSVERTDSVFLAFMLSIVIQHKNMVLLSWNLIESFVKSWSWMCNVIFRNFATFPQNKYIRDLFTIRFLDHIVLWLTYKEDHIHHQKCILITKSVLRWFHGLNIKHELAKLIDIEIRSIVDINRIHKTAIYSLSSSVFFRNF